MVGEQNMKMPGMQFRRGVDVTAELLNGIQQYISKEVTERTRDFIKYPGFSWGFQIGRIDGQSITITDGVGLDQFGVRLAHPQAAAYKLSFPSSNVLDGFLCVKAAPTPAAYKAHPYDGSRQPSETVMGLTFFIALSSSVYTDALGHLYAPSNNGLVLAKLSVNSSSYVPDSSASYRSPLLTMRDGQ